MVGREKRAYIFAAQLTVVIYTYLDWLARIIRTWPERLTLESTVCQGRGDDTRRLTVDRVTSVYRAIIYSGVYWTTASVFLSHTFQQLSHFPSLSLPFLSWTFGVDVSRL